ncbi:hypothetical protein [Labrys wisconsinensis]|uniref:Uncharacterized protein n=1 Tax=Labrys wisconsinensis TaxID=425677 RepID=A0ABU0J5N5_9HYPH|nr:hypothetical protein [Labrys wisconsinensis]MDQ0469566.1 hypothetical protein [Labrys wisconsinensis]
MAVEQAAPARRHRLVVVNFDGAWQFPRLVRQLALDLKGREDGPEVLFRTIHAEDGDDGTLARRQAVWGVAFPVAYGGDVESLVADLTEDVEALERRRVDHLALIYVGPDPAQDPEGAAQLRTVATRMREVLNGMSIVAGDVLSIACLREFARGSEVAPQTLAFLRELRRDPARAGREILDFGFVLRPSRTRTADVETEQYRQFVLLRGVIVLALARREGRQDAPLAQQSSPLAQFLRATTGEAFLLQIDGEYAALASERIAMLIGNYRERATGQTIGRREDEPGGDGPDRTGEAVNAVMRQITDAMLVRETVGMDLGGIVLGAGKAGSSDGGRPPAEKDALPRTLQAFHARGRYWSGDRQLLLEQALRDVPIDIQRIASDMRDHFEKGAEKTSHQISGSDDRKVRDRIAEIPVVNAGLTGSAAAEIGKMRLEVERIRNERKAAAEKARRAFMASLLPARRGGDRRDDANALNFEGSPQWGQLSEALAAVMPAYRGLVPRAYVWAWWLFAAATLATILALVSAKTPDDGASALRFRLSAMIPTGTAFIVTALLGAVVFAVIVRRRQRRFRAALDRVGSALMSVRKLVTDALNSAHEYVLITRQLIWLDLLTSDFDRRAGEADIEAFESAVTELTPTDSRGAGAAPSGQAAEDFFAATSATLAREVCTRWIAGCVTAAQGRVTAAEDLRFVHADSSGLARASAPGLGTFVGAPGVFLSPQEMSYVSLDLDGEKRG